jgi:hypothetical protein
VILAVSAVVILLLHSKHGSSLGVSPSPLDASTSPPVASASPPAVDPCAGKQPWISGPADDRAEAHLGVADVRTAGRAPELHRALNVLFSHRATVGQANAALCAANVDVVATLLSLRILVVQPANGAPEDVHIARGKLIAHRFVEAVAPANMASIDEGLAFKAEAARLGFNRCDWASGQLAKKLGIEKPFYCHQSERREIGEREVLYTAVRADNDCAVVGIVDDDGVFPFAARCKPSSPFAKLAATELTGEKHWSLANGDGMKAASMLLHRIDGSK